MAGLYFYAENSTAVALSAAAEKTAIQVNAPTNQRVRIQAVGAFFDGASTTAIPVRVKLIGVSTAGTSTALTLNKKISTDSETLQSSAGENFTAEGTNIATGILDEWYIHPQMGIDKTYAFAQERMVVGAGRVALKCTAPAVVNVIAKLDCEE